jgi:citrate lyase subunit beta/citryl-CoA lyase
MADRRGRRAHHHRYCPVTVAGTDSGGTVAELRSRRSTLAVPGSNPRFLEKAKGLDPDAVFLDLEDACAPLAKPGARKNIVAALNEGGWGGKVRAVRVNDWTTEWTFTDVVEVVGGAGAELDCIMLPKVADASHVQALDLLLTQVEKANGLPVGRIGIEAQIESAQGLVNVNAIAAASPRVETIVYGPADLMASLNMRSLTVGGLHPDYPGDPYHHVLVQILVAARAHGVQAIDGPFLQVRDVPAFEQAARRTAMLGFDGKWVLHPGQIDAANEIYAPSQEDYDHAELILDAYDWATSEAGGRKGSAMLGDEMIDEASRKMALVIAGKGRAAGLSRTSTFTPPGN